MRPKVSVYVNAPLPWLVTVITLPLRSSTDVAKTAMAAFFFVLLSGGWRFGQTLPPDDLLYLRATTACLSAIIVMQVACVYLCRSSIRSVFSTRLFDNHLIVAGIGLAIGSLLLVNYAPLVNLLIGTAPVPSTLWLFLLPFAAALVALEELRKWIVRQTLRRKPAIGRIAVPGFPTPGDASRSH